MNTRAVTAALIKRLIACRLVACRLVVLLGAVLPVLASASFCHAQSVLTYHGSVERSGNFVVPGLSWNRARSVHLDPSFHPRFPGHVYAQPLYWQPPRSPSGLLIVATEDDTAEAIDARSGTAAWLQRLGRPVALSAPLCGNIDPLGITGTRSSTRNRRRSLSTRWSPGGRDPAI